MIETTLLSALVILAIIILVEDMRHLSVSAPVVIAFTIIAIAQGAVFPAPALSTSSALAGASIAMAVATATRGYIHLRTGIPAFGGADVALITAAGAMIGPFALGPWLIATVGLALAIGIAASRLGFREVRIDGEEAMVMPLCPAILISLAITYGAIITQVIPATLFFT